MLCYNFDILMVTKFTSFLLLLLEFLNFWGFFHFPWQVWYNMIHKCLTEKKQHGMLTFYNFTCWYMPLGRFPRKKVFGGRTGNDAFYVSGRNQHGCTEKGVGVIDRKITLTRKQTKEIKEAGDILCSFHEFLRWNTYNYFVVKHLELHFLYERCSTNKVITTAPQYNNVN